MFFEVARQGLNDGWRYLVGVVCVILAYITGQFLIFGVLLMSIRSSTDIGQEEVDAFLASPDFEILGINKTVGLMMLIFMFVTAMIALWLVIRKLHLRPFKTLISPDQSIDWHRIAWGFGLWFVLQSIAQLIHFWIYPEQYSVQWNLASFIPLLLVALLILPIQTSFEELFFRGYLLQGIGLKAKSRWFPLIATSLLFGLMHAMNPEVDRYGFWSMELYYVCAGLFLGLITILDNRLELALGVHAAVNVFGAAVLTYESSAIQTDAIFAARDLTPLPATFALVICAAIFCWAMTRLYGWRFSWKDLKNNASANESNLEIS